MKYKHIKTGNIYELLNIANECDNEKFPKMAVYQNVNDGHVYAHPFQDFMKSFVFCRRHGAMSNEGAVDNGEENPCAVGCNIESCIYKGVSDGDCFGCVEWEPKKTECNHEWAIVFAGEQCVKCGVVK